MVVERTRSDAREADAQRADSAVTSEDGSRSDIPRYTIGECPPGHDPDRYNEVVEDRLAEMRALLARMGPASNAEALRALRAAFPETSLSTRVAAISRRPD